MGFESGARASLKAAIAARDAAASRVEATRQALNRLEDQLHEGLRKLREARAHAGEGERAEVERLIAGGSATLLERVDGRASEAEAQRQVDEAKAARELVRRALIEAENAVGWAEQKVTSAVGAVMAGSAEKLLAEAERLRLELEGKRAVLAVLRPMLPDELSRKIYMALPDLGLGNSGHPAVLAWQAAADALSKSADAALPE